MNAHRPRPVRRRLVPALVAAALAAGCHGPSVDPPSDGLALRVEQLPGGPVPAGEISLPRYVLYADGTLIAADGTDGGLPAAKTYNLTSAAFRRMYDRAASAGLAEPHDYEVQAPDAPTLVITLVTGSGRSRTRVTAPDPEGSGAAGDAVRAVAFSPDDLAASDLTGTPSRYDPTQIAVNSAFAAAGGNAPAWPLGALGSGTSVNGGHCVVYPAAKVGDLARRRPADGRWSSGGATYQVFFRPLLPDEGNCAALS
jgi:hypothetical protein